MNDNILSKLNIDYDYKFIIITSNNKIEKDVFLNFFDGLINNIKIFEIEKGYLLIYNSKEKGINFNDYYDSISFDLGFSFKFFDGFKIRKENKEYLDCVLKLYYKYIEKENDSYYKVKDIILRTTDIDELKSLKEIVLDKYLEDPEFIYLVRGLFDSDLNVSKAAKMLYMHRNTINNKLDFIANDTTLRLQKFNDAVCILILLENN